MKSAKPILSRDKDLCKGKEKENGSPALSKGTHSNGTASGGNSPPQAKLHPIKLTWDTDQGSPTMQPSQPETSKDGEAVDSSVAHGPYQLLAKERLMGIYLAIFVHRDASHFIGGNSCQTR